jgi:hypothetical protein
VNGYRPELQDGVGIRQALCGTEGRGSGLLLSSSMAEDSAVMRGLRTRIRKPEARRTDSSGLVPHTARWLDYWLPQVDGISAAENRSVPGGIPLEVVDAILARPKAGNVMLPANSSHPG